MSDSMQSNLIFKLKKILSPTGTSVKVTNDLERDLPISIIGASVVLKNASGNVLERMVCNFSGGVMTITQRGLDQSETKTTNLALQYERRVGTLGYITVLASDLMDRDNYYGNTPVYGDRVYYWDMKFYWDNQHYWDETFKNLEVTQKFRIPNFATTGDRDAIYTSPQNGNLCEVAGKLYQYDSWWKTLVQTVTWNVLDNSDPTNPIVTAVASVTWLNTDNTDPQNPVVQVSVDWVTVTWSGTPGDPLVSVGWGGWNPKPSDLDAINLPVDGYIAQKATWVDQFERVANWWWAVNYEIFDSTMTGLTPVDIVDARIDVDTPYNIYYETQPAGTITRTEIGGKITLVSDNAGDTMNFRIICFWFGSNSGYATGSTTLTGAGPWTIVDSRITSSTPVNLYPDTNVVGYLTVQAQAGQFVISSTGTEVGTVVQWIAFTSTNVNPVSDETYGPTWDSVVDQAPSKNAVYDKLETMSGSIGNADVIFFSRDITAATATITYSHSLWRIPNIIEFFAQTNTASVWIVNWYCLSNGTQWCLYGKNWYETYTTSFAQQYENNGYPTDYTTWFVQNITSTTFDIVWTKHWNPVNITTIIKAVLR